MTSTTVRVGRSSADSPSAQLALAVLYDPGDHSKVVLDRSDEGC